MTAEGRSAFESLTRLWDRAWSGVTEGPVDAVDEVIEGFEEQAAACLSEALLTGDPAAAGAYSSLVQQAFSQVVSYDQEEGQRQISRSHDQEQAARDRCIEEAERRGLTFQKVQAYGTPGDPYAFIAYAQDHPEDAVAAALLRCLQAVGEASRAESDGSQRRRAAVGELYAAAQRALSRAVQQQAAAQAAARRDRVCSLCGAVTLVREDGRCGPCRGAVAAWQGRGEATEQGWAMDSATVIPWDVLAAHVAALAAAIAEQAESSAESPGPQVDPAFQAFIESLIDALQAMVDVVQGAVAGRKPPTAEVIEHIRVPFNRTFGPSGGPAYAAAAFGHFATAHPGSWAPDPGRDLEEAMSDAARSALEYFLPEGFLDEWEDWLGRLGIGSKKKTPEGSTWDPEVGNKGGLRNEHWYCIYCGNRLSRMAQICRSCAAQERPWCQKCGWPRSAHTGERLFCPPRPRAAP